MTRRTAGAWCTAAVILLLAAGCAKAGSTGTPVTGGGTAGAGGASAAPKAGAPASQPGSPASQPKPVWFQSVQMTSATSGWALVWSANPGVIADNAHILLARTTDGARTWSDVTPAAARPMLATLYSYQALDPVDGDHAYLAVSRATSDDGVP